MVENRRTLMAKQIKLRRDQQKARRAQQSNLELQQKKDNSAEIKFLTPSTPFDKIKLTMSSAKSLNSKDNNNNGTKLNTNNALNNKKSNNSLFNGMEVNVKVESAQNGQKIQNATDNIIKPEPRNESIIPPPSVLYQQLCLRNNQEQKFCGNKMNTFLPVNNSNEVLPTNSNSLTNENNSDLNIFSQLNSSALTAFTASTAETTQAVISPSVNITTESMANKINFQFPTINTLNQNALLSKLVTNDIPCSLSSEISNSTNLAANSFNIPIQMTFNNMLATPKSSDITLKMTNTTPSSLLLVNNIAATTSSNSLNHNNSVETTPESAKSISPNMPISNPAFSLVFPPFLGISNSSMDATYLSNELTQNGVTKKSSINNAFSTQNADFNNQINALNAFSAGNNFSANNSCINMNALNFLNISKNNYGASDLFKKPSLDSAFQAPNTNFSTAFLNVQTDGFNAQTDKKALELMEKIVATTATKSNINQLLASKQVHSFEDLGSM